jgi:protein required for attachment to host cells
MSTTWILVANASTARLYENKGIGKGLQLISQLDHPESRMKGSDLVSDRGGHMQSVGNGHGARQSPTDPKQNEAEHFALDLAKTLDQGRGENKYERLIVVASNPFLGTLKTRLSNQVQGLMSEAIEKDYTKITDKELAGHLSHCIYL